MPDQDTENDKVETFIFDDLEYLLFGYQVTFDEASVICLNYNAKLAVLDTKEKADFIVRSIIASTLGKFISNP